MAAAIRLSQQHSCSFDHLVGEREQLVRRVEAERLRGLEVDDQLDFCDLLHRQVGRLFTLENAAGVDTRLAAKHRECSFHSSQDRQLPSPGARRSSIFPTSENSILVVPVRTPSSALSDNFKKSARFTR